MPDLTEGERLVIIETKLDFIIDAMTKAANSEGYPRCVERDQRLKAIEDKFKTINKIIVGLVLASTGFVGERLWSLMAHVQK